MGVSDTLSPILIVDDDAMLVASLAQLFDGKSINSDKAYTAHECIDVLRRQPAGFYKAMLLDVSMETRSAGPDILQDIRGHDSYLPVVFLSAYSDEIFAIEQIRQGAVQVLMKPVRFQTLYYCLISAVLFAKQQKELRQLEQRSRLLVINKLFNHNMKNLAWAGQTYLQSDPPSVPQATLCFRAIQDQTQRIMAMSTEPDEGDVADLADAVVRVKRELTGNPNISEDAVSRIKFSPEGALPPLHIKADTLSALLGELIYNAIVHNKHRPVRVTVSAKPVSSAHIQLRVKDDGNGISADRHHLFQVQADNTEQGFGLPYCYEVLRIHGGDIRYEHAQTGGAFVLTIPVHRPIGGGLTDA